MVLGRFWSFVSFVYMSSTRRQSEQVGEWCNLQHAFPLPNGDLASLTLSYICLWEQNDSLFLLLSIIPVSLCPSSRLVGRRPHPLATFQIQILFVNPRTSHNFALSIQLFLDPRPLSFCIFPVNSHFLCHKEHLHSPLII